MKVNKGRLILWMVILAIWSGTFLVLNYTVGQHYGKNVATQQFEQDTTAYKELKTQKAIERTLAVVGFSGGCLFLLLGAKQFKVKEE